MNSIAFSDVLRDRIAVSSDLSGSSFHHHQWKKKYVADLVIWPINVSQIQKIVEITADLDLSITVRGGGCNYFGSAHPFNGGIILDLKRMNTFQFNLKTREVTADAGTVISTVKDYLNRRSYQLCVHPTSAPSATFAGWLSTGGSIGVGTSFYGDFLSNIKKLTVISPTGKFLELSIKEDISLYVGSLGLFGIITSITFRVVPKFETYPYYIRVKTLASLNKFLSEISTLKKLYFCYFSNFDLQLKRNSHESHLVDSPFYLMFASLNQLDLNNISLNNGEITQYPTELAQKVWQERFKFEFIPKRGNTSVISQHYQISVDLLKKVLKHAIIASKKNQIRSFYSGIIVSPQQVRLSVSIPSNGSIFEHLLPSKAMLHNLTIFVYQNNGKLYTLGLLNYIYGQKFEKSNLNLLRRQKKMLDPYSRLNPGKLTSGTATYFRMQILFKLNSFWRIHLRGRKNSRERKFHLENKIIQSPGIFDLCSSCGYCRIKCPAYLVDPNEVFSPSGRFRLLSTMIEEKKEKITSEFIDPLFRCTTCQACETVCPVNVPIVKITEYLREIVNSSSK